MKYVRHLWSGREKNSTSQQTARKDDKGRKHMRKIFSDWVLQYNKQSDKLGSKNKTVTFYADKNCFKNLITWKRTNRKLKNENYFEALNQFVSLVLKTFSWRNQSWRKIPPALELKEFCGLRSGRV